MLLHDYLEEEAKFPGLPTSGTTTTVNELTLSEFQYHLAAGSLPLDAFRDDTMVENLLAELKHYLGRMEIDFDGFQQAYLSSLFVPSPSLYGFHPWDTITCESDVCLSSEHCQLTAIF